MTRVDLCCWVKNTGLVLAAVKISLRPETQSPQISDVYKQHTGDGNNCYHYLFIVSALSINAE